jgi:hypothetical protein
MPLLSKAGPLRHRRRAQPICSSVENNSSSHRVFDLLTDHPRSEASWAGPAPGAPFHGSFVNRTVTGIGSVTGTGSAYGTLQSALSAGYEWIIPGSDTFSASIEALSDSDREISLPGHLDQPD